MNGRGRVRCFAYKSCFALARKEVQVATKSETEAEAEGQRLLGGARYPREPRISHSHSLWIRGVRFFASCRRRENVCRGLPFSFSACSVMADLARTCSALSPWTRTFRLYDSSIFTLRHIPLEFYGPMRCCCNSTILGRSFARLRSCARQGAK